MITDITYNSNGLELVKADTLYNFFKNLFQYFETKDIDAEIYCNDESYIIVNWDDRTDTNCDICNFIVSAYESMVLWHDGKKGYELLSLLSQHYKPSPLGESDPNILGLMKNVFDRHFEGKGGY